MHVKAIILLGRLPRYWTLISCMSNSRHYERHWKVPSVYYLSLTQSIVSLIRVTFMLPPSAAEVLKYHRHVAENNQRRWENRSFMECHDKLVPLKLPNLVWYRFDFEKRVARRQERRGKYHQTENGFGCFAEDDMTTVAITLANVSLSQKQEAEQKSKFVPGRNTVIISLFEVPYDCKCLRCTTRVLQQPIEMGMYFYPCFPYCERMMP